MRQAVVVCFLVGPVCALLTPACDRPNRDRPASPVPGPKKESRPYTDSY
jgi:hypothetical protein